MAAFAYKGKKYHIDKVTELAPDSGNKYFLILTKDNHKFKLVFEESIFRWIITEAD